MAVDGVESHMSILDQCSQAFGLAGLRLVPVQRQRQWLDTGSVIHEMFDPAGVTVCDIWARVLSLGAAEPDMHPSVQRADWRSAFFLARGTHCLEASVPTERQCLLSRRSKR
jgi:hypothetical protein